MATIKLDLDLELVTCPACGISFGVPATTVHERRRDHASFYCPNGHSQYFPGQSDLEKAKAEAEHLRGELAAARQNAKYYRDRRDEEQERADRERARANGYKGQMVRTKKRVAAGVCPCCNRTFQNLHRHMQTKHPQYASNEEELPERQPRPLV